MADKFVSKGTPIYNQDERLDLLHALKVVDEVMLCTSPGPEAIINEIRPHVYVRGADYVGKEMPESALLRRLGIPVRYTTSPHQRTSDIITRVLTVHKAIRK